MARRSAQGDDGHVLVVAQVLPDVYPLNGELDDYIAGEHTVGRVLDLGIIEPRLGELYRWSAKELQIPELADLVRGGTPAYAWDPGDSEPWAPSPTRLVRVMRRTLPPLVKLGAELVTLSARTRCTQPGRWWQRVGVDQVRAPRRVRLVQGPTPPWRLSCPTVGPAPRSKAGSEVEHRIVTPRRREQRGRTG